MQRPIRGRIMETQSRAKSLWTGSHSLDTTSSFHIAPKQEDSGHDASSSVWNSAILFPDVPHVHQEYNSTQPTMLKDIESNKPRGMSNRNAIPTISSTGDDEVSQNATFLYEELSILYQKWSDEDGTDLKMTANESNQHQSFPSDEIETSLENQHQGIRKNGGEVYNNGTHDRQKSSEDSMTLAFNKMSLTLVKNQMLFHSSSRDPTEDQQMASSASSQLTLQSYCQQNTPSPQLPQQSTTESKQNQYYSRPSVSNGTIYLVADKTTENGIGYCNMCKRNGETREFYTSHVIKDSNGNVVCPVLRAFVCPVCGATGSNSHTISYCPIARRNKKV